MWREVEPGQGFSVPQHFFRGALGPVSSAACPRIAADGIGTAGGMLSLFPSALGDFSPVFHALLSSVRTLVDVSLQPPPQWDGAGSMPLYLNGVIGCDVTCMHRVPFLCTCSLLLQV